MTDSVHVLRVPALPDNQEAAVALDCDGSMIIYMREDHTTIGYALGWGQTTPKEPFLVDIKAADWGKIIEFETEWKKQQKYI